jgi:hypothetical protein
MGGYLHCSNQKWPNFISLISYSNISSTRSRAVTEGMIADDAEQTETTEATDKANQPGIMK